MMRALNVADGFGLDRMALREVPRPSPGPLDVLLRVRAASLNYRDLLVAQGKYNPRFPLPLTLGSDAVAEIVELGGEVQQAELRVGTRVVIQMVQGWLTGPPARSATQHTLGGPLPGVFAEYVVARADSVLPAPAYLDDVEAACLPCAALTAMSALADDERLARGGVLLTQGSGGVSLFALQIARAMGGRVFVTSRSAEKRERLAALSAEQVLPADSAGLAREVRRLTEGEGADHVIEVSGGATVAESLQAVRPGGRVSLIGTLSGHEARLDLLPIVMRNVRVQGVFVGHLARFRSMLALFDAHQIRPIVDSVFELADAHAAFARLASAAQFGKICLCVAS